ncbi:transmembrane 6 superfamily member 2 isoform X3 [Phascolarctos cinereus]|uniref:Transmembrane 6 superfamily member 2 isoform X3 n=1 Tax=Phascolarctos cinereus TaxID=38626 RepID=A0A6P5ISG5_PHACI|nr:transmembrane 6 superfamily member 2 isoform X3 [Phascolarctos cinereus]
MELPELSGKVVAFSLTALPVCYALNHLSELSHPLGMAILSAMILALLFVAISNLAQGEISHDPLFAVFTVFSFTSLIDLFIALEEDDYVMGLMEFYTREREPYLRTAHGIFSCYWDGTVNYLLYLIMTGAIAKSLLFHNPPFWVGNLQPLHPCTHLKDQESCQFLSISLRKRYRSLGLYWLGSLVMSIMVFVPGNILGKYSSELRLSFLLNIPYVLIPCWAGLHLFRQAKGPAGYTVDMILEEHKKGLLQRPWDLALFIFLLLAGLFTIFRGLVVLDCPTDSCFIYVYQYEPYLRDPVAYPKIQAQFSHIGASMHPHTPYPYRTPEDVWSFLFILNLLYAVGPHLLAYRCIRWPAFFLCPPTLSQQEKNKKNH